MNAKPHWYEPAGPKVNRLLDSVAQKRDALSRKWTTSINSQLPITCGSPCASCCHQLVPTWLSEGLLIARHLLVTGAEVVHNLEPLLAASREASQFMEAHGYGSAAWDGEASSALWFRLAKPCVFLQQELCSLYEHRPTPCRSMLVVSEPQLCANADNTIKAVDVTPWMTEGFDNDRWFTHVALDRPMVWPLALPHAVFQGLTLLTNGMRLSAVDLRVHDAPR